MSPIYDITGAILDIIEHSGQCLGYRTVWTRLCSQYNIRVTRNEVMKLMRVIDGQAVERRRKRRLLRRIYICRGPNYVWHIYGYDKLKPFGFAIHGAANQRIEAWWSILRRQASDWWLNFCKNLRDDGLIRDHECVKHGMFAVLFHGSSAKGAQPSGDSLEPAYNPNKEE